MADPSKDKSVPLLPWVYRCRFTNWLMARPWRWHYWALYRMFRAEQCNPFTGRLYVRAHDPLQAAWLALSFPHVHHWSEEAEPSARCGR